MLLTLLLLLVAAATLATVQDKDSQQDAPPDPALQDKGDGGQGSSVAVADKVTEDKSVSQSLELPTEVQKIIDDASKESARLGRLLMASQERVKVLEGDKSTEEEDEEEEEKPPAPKKKTTTKTAARLDRSDEQLLKGLRRDENGDVELYGTMVAPEFAVNYLRQAEESRQFRENRQERDDKEIEQHVSRAASEFEQGTRAAIGKIVDAALPVLGSELRPVVIEAMEAWAAGMMRGSKEFTDAMAQKDEVALTREFGKIGRGCVQRVWMIHQALSSAIESMNEEQRSKFPFLKTEETTGVPAPKALRAMTSSEREAAALRAARIAERMSAGAS